MAEKTRNYGTPFQLQGQAAVYQVASQLALRGHVVMFPMLDVGYDLQLENGLRLQVKSSTIRWTKGVNYPYGAYAFGVRRGAWDSAEKKYKKSTLRSYSEIADFFVLWGIDENRFWILSTQDKRSVIWFNRKGFESTSPNRRVFNKRVETRLGEMEDRWDLLDVNGTSQHIVKSAMVGSPKVDKNQKDFVFEPLE